MISTPPSKTRSGDRTRLTAHEEAALWVLEEQFWTGGLDGARTTTAQGAVMIFPYPVGILQGDKIWQFLKLGTPWRSVRMSDQSFSRRGDIVVLAYGVSAEKPDTVIYEAFCASAYLLDHGKWIRLSHQQTAIS
ncbi:hypothetical protein ROA7745_04295 [Roseovarius aestuarii]|uniref:DUF4440 domain-containing protein n=1 Tax=Roseovarius aestuarii TaxID=475083 RepID=A0A1X7BXU8_9RHOB|nr:hypothetical protein ROA7745_04295 [Roseovarius aestuarii]